jgi:outer membrane protein TolC
MKTAWIIVLAAAAFSARAQDGSSKPLSLAAYLEQVKQGSPQARAEVEAVNSAEGRLRFAEIPLSPEAYSEYSLFDNREQPTIPLMMPPETRGRQWKLGVRDQTLYGNSVDVYFGSTRTNLVGFKPAFSMPLDYENSGFGVNVKQSLWRNGFGETTRATYRAQSAADKATLLAAQFRLKNILLQAENTYWAVVSYNEIIKLQTENVERARGLRDHMKKSASMRLFDDVDYMQTEASFEQRDLELQNSINARAVLMRDFNTLRGKDGDAAENLQDLPTSEFMLKTVNDPSKRMSREDFRATYEQATSQEQMAIGAKSELRPQLDLVAGISGHGLDSSSGVAYSDASRGQHPDWNIGLQFSVPLDYRLINETKRAYEAEVRSAKARHEQAKFDEARAWDDLIKKNREAQAIFERSISLEKLQTDLVKRERRRLLNGRSTTLQTVTIEQNLALSQISRVQSQLALLQVHNLIKQFEEIP